MKTILIFFGEEYVEISAQRNFCYENICGKDFEVVCDGENVSLNGTTLRMYELMNIGKLEIMLFENNEKHYSFNYTKNSFVEIPKEEITKNMENKKIGTYLNERIPFTVKEKESY